MQVVTTRECLTGEGGITRQFSGIPSTPSTIVTTRQCLPPPTPSPTPVTACCEHVLLDSAVHTDTLTGSVVAGALIMGNATPKWALLAPGTPGQALIINAGGVPTWTGLAASTHTVLDSTVHTDTLTAAVVRGGLMVGNATLKWALVVVDTNNRIFVNDGTDSKWGKVDLAAATNVTGTVGVPNGGTGAATLTGIVQGNAALAMTAITGTANYLPKWSATAPYLTATSKVFDNGTDVGINTILPVTELMVVSTGSADPRGIMSAQYSTDAIGARFHFRKSRGTETVPVVVVTADMLGRIRFSGYDGANFLQSGSIDVSTNGTIAATRVPTYMAFSTATDATPSVLTERMRILGNGMVGVGTIPIQQFEVGGITSPRMSVKSSSTNSDVGYLFETSDLSRQAAITWNYSIGNALTFHTSGIGTAQTRMSISTTGQVGIGLATVIASNRLHVSIDDAVTAAVTTVSRIDHSSSGTPGVGFGGGLLWALESSTTINQDAGAINVAWTDATHATRTSAMLFQTVNSAAAIANRMALSGAGGLSVGDGTTTTAVGVINAVTGYRVASAAATSGTFLQGNGTNFVPSSFVMPSSFTAGSVIFAGAGGTTLAEDNANFFWNDSTNVLSIGSNSAPADAVRLYTANSGAVTTNQTSVRVVDTATSSTASRFKYGIFIDLSGNWSGGSSHVWAVSANVAGAAATATDFGGVEMLVSGSGATARGFYASVTATGADSYGIQASAQGATSNSNTGGYFLASGAFSSNIGVQASASGTGAFAAVFAGGKVKNDSVASVICANAALATNATGGFLYLPTSAGSPTGTPATETGTAACEYDTTNRALSVYSTAWYQYSRRSITSSTTQQGNTALTETDLFTTSVAAGTGTINGCAVDFMSAGSFATSISTDKRIRCYWAGVLIFDSGALAITSTASWSLFGTVIRVDATNFKASVSLSTSSGTLSAYASYVGGASTWANANTLKITGQGTNASDVVGEFWKVGYEM